MKYTKYTKTSLFNSAVGVIIVAFAIKLLMPVLDLFNITLPLVLQLEMPYKFFGYVIVLTFSGWLVLWLMNFGLNLIKFEKKDDKKKKQS